MKNSLKKIIQEISYYFFPLLAKKIGRKAFASILVQKITITPDTISFFCLQESI